MEAERTAEDVFRLLSDEIRLDVLRAVARAQDEQKETGVARLSFSDVYERVDVDNTSKLSYHLGELTGTFLGKDENGYAFTHAGEQMVRFILAENYRPPPDVGAVDVDGSCLHCGEEALRAMVEDQYFVVRCGACDRPVYSYKVRPAQAQSHAGATLADAVARDQMGDLLKVRRGVCPDCGGHTDTRVIDTEDLSVPDPAPASFGTVSECGQCLRFLSFPLTHWTAFHPASIAFHWEHGVDILGTRAWEFASFLHDGRWSSERVDTDPDEYRVELQFDAASLRLYLDEDAAVTRTERVRHRDQRDRRA